MKNKVLYFPYINVPNSVWFTRMLLYWDEVGAIVPHDFIEKPERLNEHMRSLVQANLVRQIIPAQYIHEIPNYVEAFIEYVESLGTLLDKRRTTFMQGQKGSRIHIEKMDYIASILVDMKLAKKKEYPWYEVEPETGKEFMAYIAATLGKLEDLEYIPVTDKLEHLNDFIFSSSKDLQPEKKISTLRLQLLEDLLPAPVRPLTASEIEMFKSKHNNKLSAFRRMVEEESIKIACISDEDLRQRQINIFKGKSKESIEQIKAALKESGFKRLSLAVFGEAISEIPGISKIYGLAKAVKEAFNAPCKIEPDKSFLYAAYAQKELLI